MNEQPGVTVQRRRTRAEVEQVVAEFTGSGLTRREFCQRQGMSLGTLHRYLKQIREEGGSGSAKGRLIAVELASTKLVTDKGGSGGLAVVLCQGRRIEVGAGFDARTLERLVDLLEKI